MRAAARLLAAVKPGRILEPGAPTGLTGLYTHAAPRSTLVYLYSETLDRLKKLPESSVYRQSTEALTRRRLDIVEAIEPAGLKEWHVRVQKQVDENPNAFGAAGAGVKHVADGRSFVMSKEKVEADERYEEWDGEVDDDPVLEGSRTSAERSGQRKALGEDSSAFQQRSQTLALEKEPSLTAEQIADMENQIGAGLIEEVIQVAEGELKLVDEMEKHRVWEELCERPTEGQWKYFERGAMAHTTTQKP